MDTILQVDNLTKQYADFKLDHVSFSVPKGTIMGLIGENGAGKSTTINAILDLIHKDDGTVTFSDVEHLWIVMTKEGKKVMKLYDIINSNYKENEFFIPLCEPVKYNNVNHLISPYKMGKLIYDNFIPQQ